MANPTHGTVARYVAGCRDRCCKDAVARYERERQLDRLSGRIRRTSSIGTQRRLQALAVMGWPSTAIGAEAGVTGEHIQNLWRGRNAVANTTTAAMVVRVYDRLSMTPGPSAITRRRAVARGWLPPLAWDDDTIDLPDTAPALGKYRTAQVVFVDDVEALAEAGVTWSEAERRIGRSRNSIEMAMNRLGRNDLMRRLSRNSVGEFALREYRNKATA